MEHHDREEGRNGGHGPDHVVFPGPAHARHLEGLLRLLRLRPLCGLAAYHRRARAALLLVPMDPASDTVGRFGVAHHSSGAVVLPRPPGSSGQLRAWATSPSDFRYSNNA